MHDGIIATQDSLSWWYLLKFEDLYGPRDMIESRQG